MGSIYKITNTVNGKAYIGQTIQDAVNGRINAHLTGKASGSRLVRQAVEKHGKDTFTYEIIHDGIISEFLDTLEIEAIAKFNTIAPHGYNQTNGGSGSGTQVSPETRRRMSKAHKGKKHSEKTKRKMSKIRKGKPRPEKTKRKISKARKGRPGKSPSEETRRKQSKAMKGRPGKPLSAETKRKISKAQETPERTAAHNLFFSLPSEMDLKEKRRLLHQKITGVHKYTINRWIRKWTKDA